MEISSKKKKKQILIIGVSFNIFILGYFKYSDFFIENFNTLLNANTPLLHLALPLAISFFTFQQIAYLVDSYREETKDYSFIDYMLFVTFFPQLIAGPIVHHKEMIPQFTNIKNHLLNYENISKGIFIFSIGLFKKVIIADTFSTWATSGFDIAPTLNFFEAWSTSLSYTFQLYFDFSGYTDMAIGLALLFNIHLPVNFNSPYKARNIQDFWRRWHITLSRFLKEYIYIPLGGNRKGERRIYINLILTFLIGGIWHGAGWTFIFWGLLHGIALSFHRLWSKLSITLPLWLAWFVTFNFINISWIFFRAKEWEDALKVLKGMFGQTAFILPSALENKFLILKEHNIGFGSWLANIQGDLSTAITILLTFFLILLFKNSMEKLHHFQLNYRTLSLSALLFISSVLSLNKVSEFLYFNF
jgi:D-alanyl-lipoteichoic acid acyltransferase DltB (MBOAT superfamily)